MTIQDKTFGNNASNEATHIKAFVQYYCLNVITNILPINEKTLLQTWWQAKNKISRLFTDFELEVRISPTWYKAPDFSQILKKICWQPHWVTVLMVCKIILISL